MGHLFRHAKKWWQCWFSSGNARVGVISRLRALYQNPDLIVEAVAVGAMVIEYSRASTGGIACDPGKPRRSAALKAAADARPRAEHAQRAQGLERENGGVAWVDTGKPNPASPRDR